MHFIPRKPPAKVLIILDGHTSHCSAEMIEIAKQNKIILLCLPSHCTALQLFEKSFVWPLKYYYTQETVPLMKNHPKRNYSRYQAGEIIGKAWVRQQSINS